MKLSDKQALQLFLIAVYSLEHFVAMGINRDDRQILVDEIANQQSDELVDLKEVTVKRDGEP